MEARLLHRGVVKVLSGLGHHLGLIAIALPLINFFHLSIEFLKVSDWPRHVNHVLEGEGGRLPHRWGVPDRVSRHSQVIVAELSPVLDGLGCLLEGLDVLGLPIFVVLSHTQLALAGEVALLELLSLLERLDHSVLKIELVDVHVKVPVDVGVAVKEH